MEDNMPILKSYTSVSEKGDVTLGINIVAQDVVAFLKAVNTLKLLVRNWYKQHSSKCSLVELTVITPKSNHVAIDEIIGKKLASDPDLAFILQHLRFNVNILDEIWMLKNKKSYAKKHL